jgi:signal transduction histidine kinase
MVEFANPNKYQTRRVEISELLDKSLDILASDLKHKSIRVIKDIPSGLPAVMVNEREMYQVFVNVLLNAVDSMDSGGTLFLSCSRPEEEGNDWLRIAIRDTGCGISEDNLIRIFSRYFTTKSTGTGLGLSIVERIIAVHNGKIDVKSEVGKGTEFTIDLKI